MPAALAPSTEDRAKLLNVNPIALSCPLKSCQWIPIPYGIRSLTLAYKASLIWCPCLSLRPAPCCLATLFFAHCIFQDVSWKSLSSREPSLTVISFSRVVSNPSGITQFHVGPLMALPRLTGSHASPRAMSVPCALSLTQGLPPVCIEETFDELMNEKTWAKWERKHLSDVCCVHGRRWRHSILLCVVHMVMTELCFCFLSFSYPPSLSSPSFLSPLV